MEKYWLGAVRQPGRRLAEKKKHQCGRGRLPPKKRSMSQLPSSGKIIAEVFPARTLKSKAASRLRNEPRIFRPSTTRKHCLANPFLPVSETVFIFLIRPD